MIDQNQDPSRSLAADTAPIVVQGAVEDRPVPSTAADPASRRKLLLRGLVGAPVLLAAASRKAQSYSTTRYCSYSGMQSAAVSHAPTPTCTGGYSPGYYKTLSHWPPAPLKVNGYTFTSDSKFSKVFGSGPNYTLIDILLNHTNTPEFHWIAALLNALTASLGFPYTASQVVNYYNNPTALAAGATQYSVEQFFENNFENL
jgi:hypothetical protein